MGALLGHNGAGKTTLLNILTGILAPNEGSVQIEQFDLEDDLSEIRGILGVCPQFDILWNDLTPAEHIYLFARIKNVDPGSIDELIETKLSQVNLLAERNALIRTFSGGMKRRLSIALSSVGTPRVILLDEPTTGMDPVSRAQVWHLIKDLKKDRMVLLTTHAMEEADVLADRIVVVVDGRVKCDGTALHLKNTYGDGYRLNIVTRPNRVEALIEIVSHVLPNAKVFDVSAGNILFMIPFNYLSELKLFFQIIEGKFADHVDEAFPKLRRWVLDYGLSHTTLEEVFMKVTSKKDNRRY
eukprot:TRINITY_DN7034_c0_g1_i1.p1 TRINITY_DN7034_c0_g1~~TRINITY_DN7034_c0_g1_i1.p1  ORF type:complete len:298 (-),score=59.86 TRINITY_DN7034_c0_g1_i1:152-1045(-)